jgi:hypothetical protein
VKKLIVFIAGLFILSATDACPICGCGVGNFYMGLLPNFKSRFIGLRYQFMSYHTQIAGDATQHGNDFYKTAELWSGWNIGSKWQLLSFIPYHFNNQNTDDGINRQNGIGDVSLLVNYKLLDTHNVFKNNNLSSQQLWIGGGVKLPTGKYHVDLNSPDANLGDVNSQMGTGSVDFLLNAAYNVRINSFGINTSLNYKINTTNNDHYNFGNRFSANSFGYYQTHIHKLMIMPNAGLLYEHAAGNSLSSQKVNQTGGYVALAATGVELGYKKINVGMNVQMPFSQNFAEGQTTAKTRGLAHITFTL